MGNTNNARIETVFQKLDKDGTGYLNFDEIAPVGDVCEMPMDKLSKAFDKADKSKDGRISLVEAKSLFISLKMTEEHLSKLEAALEDVLLVIPNVTVLSMKGLQSEGRKGVARGDLQVSQIKETKQILLNVSNKFVYALKKNIPTVRIASHLYLAPTGAPDEYYGFVIPDTTGIDLLNSLDSVLDSNSYFKRFHAAPGAEKKGVGASPQAFASKAVSSKPGFFATIKAKADKAVSSVKKSESYKKATKLAAQKIKQIEKSEAYQKASAAAKEQMKKVAESEAFKSVKAKADKAIDEVKKSDAYNKAKEGIKKGAGIVAEKIEEGYAYAGQVIESQKGKSIGDKVSAGVNVAADGAVAAIGITATFAAGTVRQTAKILKKTLKPAQKEKKVSERTKTYVKTAANWSGKAVVVSKHAASTALAVADALSHKLTEAIEGTKMYKDNKEKLNSKAAQDTKKVVKAGIEGSFKIMDAMIDAGLLFIAEVTLAAAEVTEHTQGADVGAVAKDAGMIVNNAARAGANLRYVGLTPLAKRAVLGTTIEMLGTEEEKKLALENKKENATANLAVHLVAAQAASM
ncbi:hypothetical protein AAMO2058_001000800 [Amorphochlora amoebiformis]